MVPIDINEEGPKETLTGILQVIHVINAVLMAWPFYALVVVNQRGRLGPPRATG